MLHLVVRHKESTERVKWRREERGRGSDRGNRLAPDQVELVWEGSRKRKKRGGGEKLCMQRLRSRLSLAHVVFVRVGSSTNDLWCHSHICIYSSPRRHLSHSASLCVNEYTETPANCADWHIFK